MNIDNSTSGTSVGIPALLGITFIILKLCGVIKWSWLWVLSPFWISIVIAVIVFVVLCIIAIKS